MRILKVKDWLQVEKESELLKSFLKGRLPIDIFQHSWDTGKMDEASILLTHLSKIDGILKNK